MTKYLPFYLDENRLIQNDKTFMITGNYLAYLTAFLNSSLFKYCFESSFPQLGEDRKELRKIVMETISVKRITDEQNDVLHALTKEIQEYYTENKYKKIDEIIFDIYGITSEERRVIRELVKS